MRRALMLALGFMGVGALIIWYVVGRRALKTHRQRFGCRTAPSWRAISRGACRSAVPGTSFDRLSVNLNAMLERIASLNEGLKTGLRQHRP